MVVIYPVGSSADGQTDCTWQRPGHQLEPIPWEEQMSGWEGAKPTRNPEIIAVQGWRKGRWYGEDCSREEADSESVKEAVWRWEMSAPRMGVGRCDSRDGLRK